MGEERAKAICELCGEQMPEDERMFRVHGYSGTCPKPPLSRHDHPIVEEARAEAKRFFAKECNIEVACFVDGARFAAARLTTALAERDAAIAVLSEALTRGAQVTTAGLLRWIADRLVSVHGENPNVDYVLSLRERADRIDATLETTPASASAMVEELRAAREVVKEMDALPWLLSHRASCNKRSRKLEEVLMGCNCDLGSLERALRAYRSATGSMEDLGKEGSS